MIPTLTTPDDTVYWSARGRVLHRSPACPQVKVIIRRAVGERVGDLKMFSFDEDVMNGGSPYPPETWPLCRLRACR